MWAALESGSARPPTSPSTSCRPATLDYRTAYQVVGIAVRRGPADGLRGIDLDGALLDAAAQEHTGGSLGLDRPRTSTEVARSRRIVETAPLGGRRRAAVVDAMAAVRARPRRRSTDRAGPTRPSRFEPAEARAAAPRPGNFVAGDDHERRLSTPPRAAPGRSTSSTSGCRCSPRPSPRRAPVVQVDWRIPGRRRPEVVRRADRPVRHRWRQVDAANAEVLRRLDTRRPVLADVRHGRRGGRRARRGTGAAARRPAIALGRRLRPAAPLDAGRGRGRGLGRRTSAAADAARVRPGAPRAGQRARRRGARWPPRWGRARPSGWSSAARRRAARTWAPARPGIGRRRLVRPRLPGAIDAAGAAARDASARVLAAAVTRTARSTCSRSPRRACRWATTSTCAPRPRPTCCCAPAPGARGPRRPPATGRGRRATCRRTTCSSSPWRWPARGR